MEYYVMIKYLGGHSIHGPFNDPDVAMEFSVNPVFKTYDFVTAEIVNYIRPEEMMSLNDPRTSLINAYVTKGLELPPELQDPEEEVVAPE